MATIENNIKKGQYLKKTGADSYVHYHFDTDDSIVYLSEKIDGENGSGAAYAKDVTLHETLCALYTLASQGGKAATDLAELATLVEGHLNNTNNPHGVDKDDVKLGSVVNAPMDDTPTKNSPNYVKSGGVYDAVKNVDDKVGIVLDIANGQSHAWVFANVDGLKSGTLSNNQFISGYKVGDSIYIIAPDVSDFWISAVASTGTASTDNAIKTAKKGDTVVVKWASSYVSLTALESKRDLNGYATTSALNSALKNVYDKATIEKDYVPYSGATKDVNIGNHTLTVGDATVQANPINTKIAGGNITLNGLAKLGTTTTNVGRKVEINVTGITVDEEKTYKYPLGNSGTLATQEFVTGRGYQTSDQVGALINGGTVKLKGDVIGNGKVNDTGITTTLSITGITPGTYSALAVDAKGRATAGFQQIIFAPNLDDPNLNKLAINGVAIIDA